jgi:hypothetical protein
MDDYTSEPVYVEALYAALQRVAHARRYWVDAMLPALTRPRSKLI